MGNTSSTPAFSIPFQRTTAQDICQKKLMPFLLADGVGFFRQCQVWNIVVSNANVLNFHMQSPFWLILLLYRRRNASSNVQSPPVLRKAKPGTHAQSIISLIKMKNPNAFPMGNKFGFFIYGGAEGSRTPVRKHFDRTFSGRRTVSAFPPCTDTGQTEQFSRVMMHGRGNSYPPHVRHINDALPGLWPLRFRRLP